MELMVLLTADYASVERSTGKLNVLGAFSRVFAESFPCRHHRMAVVLRLKPDFGDHTDNRELSIVLSDEDGTELVRFVIPFRFPLGEGGSRPEFQGVIELNNLLFPHPGLYEFAILVDNQFLGNTSIELVEAPAR